MILQQLYRDAEAILQEDLPPPMYDTRPVRWVIPLRRDGTLDGREFISLGGDKANRKGLPRLVPYPGPRSGSVIRPALLVDYPAYVLGLAPEDKRAAEKHARFKERVQECLEATADEGVSAVSRFLSRWAPDAANVPADMTPQDLVAFQVDGAFPHDQPCVRAFWAANAREAPEGGKDALVAQCLVSGVTGPVDESLPGMVKGLPGGQTSGVAFISANEGAFESHGLKRAQTSPVSREAAERFTKALNHLISQRGQRLMVGNLVYFFWTKDGPAEDIIEALDQAPPERVRDLLNSARTGRFKEAGFSGDFYAAAICASGARVQVRDWLHTTLGTARQNIASWFEAQEVVAWDGGPPEYLNAYRLASAAYRDATKEMQAGVPAALIRSALRGEAIPWMLLNRAVLRCRAEQDVRARHAALIKAVLVTNRKAEAKLTGLDSDYTDPGYVCGRLLAILERIQYAAQGNINTTLVDRYYGAASTRPSIVLGGLIKQANRAHLSKVRRRDGVTRFMGLQNALAEALALLPPVNLPKVLNLEEQALFALGYYHQRAADRQAASDAREARKGKLENDTEETNQ